MLRQFPAPGAPGSVLGRERNLKLMFVWKVQLFVWLPLFCLCLGQFELKGGQRRLDGREIYRQLCVKCHGQNGQGVKAKYADPLQGDWPIEKLTRYIDKK